MFQQHFEAAGTHPSLNVVSNEGAEKHFEENKRQQEAMERQFGGVRGRGWGRGGGGRGGVLPQWIQNVGQSVGLL